MILRLMVLPEGSVQELQSNSVECRREAAAIRNFKSPDFPEIDNS